MPLGERALEPAALIRDDLRFSPHLPRLRLEGGKRTVGRGNAALGVSQGVARFLSGVFLALQVARERVDALAQRLEIFFFRRIRGAGQQAE